MKLFTEKYLGPSAQPSHKRWPSIFHIPKFNNNPKICQIFCQFALRHNKSLSIANFFKPNFAQQIIPK